MARAKHAKRPMPPKIVAERKRVQRELLDRFEALWKARSKEDGNTQAATMARANLSVQQWGNWDRLDDDMTLTSIVAVASSLEQRVDIELRAVNETAAKRPGPSGVANAVGVLLDGIEPEALRNLVALKVGQRIREIREEAEVELGMREANRTGSR